MGRWWIALALLGCSGSTDAVVELFEDEQGSEVDREPTPRLPPIAPPFALTYDCFLSTPWGGTDGPTVRVDLAERRGWRTGVVATPPPDQREIERIDDPPPPPPPGRALTEAEVSRLDALAREVLARTDWEQESPPPESQLCRLEVGAADGSAQRAYQRIPPGGSDAVDRTIDALMALPIAE